MLWFLLWLCGFAGLVDNLIFILSLTTVRTGFKMKLLKIRSRKLYRKEIANAKKRPCTGEKNEF